MTKTYTKKDQAGVPVGGTTGEVLKKNSGTDFDYDWGTGGGTPGGSTTQLQYNNAGAFGGISGATTNGTSVTYTTGNLIGADIKAASSAGLQILGNSGTVTALFGAGGGANSTFYGGSKFDYATLSTIAIFDSSKNLISAATATYPDLTELSYVKGVTSAIQTQLNAKEAALTFSTGLTRATNTITANLSTGISGGQSVIGGTASGNNLTLSSTSNATKGNILFGTSNYDEALNQLNITNSGQDTWVTATGNINSFFQANLQNTNPGASASTDWVVTADNGSSTTHYADFGINSSGGGGAPFTTANHAYLYSIDDTLNIGALGASSQVRIFTTGGTSPVQRAVFDENGRFGITTPTPTSKVHILTNSLGTTQADSSGIFLENATAATSVLQQYSPALTLSNFSWTTNAGGSSQSSKLRIDNAPIQKSTTTVAANFRVQQSNNGGAYSDLFNVGGTTAGGTGINIGVQGNTMFSNAGGVHTFVGGGSGFGFSSSGLISRATMDNNGIWALTPASSIATSGTVSSWSHTATFAPTSGTGVFNEFTLTPTINQTGVTGTPITRGLYINPTLTSASDFRAIDVTAGRSIFAGRVQFGKGADVASANDLTLGAGGNVFVITGTTTINAITVAAWQAGSEITLIFSGALTVKHNTAGGAGTARIFLAGSVDLTTAANTVLTLVYDGTQWQQKSIKVA